MFSCCPDVVLIHARLMVGVLMVRKRVCFVYSKPGTGGKRVSDSAKVVREAQRERLRAAREGDKERQVNEGEGGGARAV